MRRDLTRDWPNQGNRHARPSSKLTVTPGPILGDSLRVSSQCCWRAQVDWASQEGVACSICPAGRSQPRVDALVRAGCWSAHLARVKALTNTKVSHMLLSAWAWRRALGFGAMILEVLGSTVGSGSFGRRRSMRPTAPLRFTRRVPGFGAARPWLPGHRCEPRWGALSLPIGIRWLERIEG